MQGTIKEVTEFLNMRKEFQIIAFILIAKYKVSYGEMEVDKFCIGKSFININKIRADIKDILLIANKF